jgi:hypothetical protein
MALNTASRVLFFTWPVPFNTRETVALDTPARMETSNMVIINGLPLQHPLWQIMLSLA